MGLSSRVEAVSTAWQRTRRARSEERAARLLRVAEHNAEVAAARYQAMRTAASSGSAISTPAETAAPRRPLPSWQQLLLFVVGGGLLTGLLVMWLLATAYVGPAALLVLPATAGVGAGLIWLRRRRPPATAVRRRPLVADLVRAAQELRDAEAALRRLPGEQEGSAADPAPNPQSARSRLPWRGPRSGASQT